MLESSGSKGGYWRTEELPSTRRWMDRWIVDGWTDDKGHWRREMNEWRVVIDGILGGEIFIACATFYHRVLVPTAAIEGDRTECREGGGSLSSSSSTDIQHNKYRVFGDLNGIQTKSHAETQIKCRGRRWRRRSKRLLGKISNHRRGCPRRVPWKLNRIVVIVL